MGGNGDVGPINPNGDTALSGWGGGMGPYVPAISGGGGGGGGAPDVISPFGWFVTAASALTGDFDPVGNPQTISVTSPGYTTAGAATTVTGPVYKMKRKRLSYPAQATLTAAEYVLSRTIYAGEVVAGVTNNSTEQFPRPIVEYMTPEWEVSNSTLTIDVFVAHRFARHGAPVARVEIKAGDGTNTITAVASLVSAVDALTGITVPRYRATLNLAASGLTPGTISVWPVVYPWVGTVFDVSTQGAAYPNATYVSVQKHIYGTIDHWAYVTPGAAGPGVVQATEALARATTAAHFATFDAAKAALIAAKGNLSRTAIMLAPSNTFTYARFDNAALGTEPAYVYGDGTGATRPILVPSVGGGVDKTPKLLRMERVRMVQQVASTIAFGNRTTDATATTVLVDYVFDRNGQTAAAAMKDIGRVQMVRVESIGYTAGANALMSNASGYHRARQVGTKGIVGQQTMSMIGCDCRWAADGTDGGAFAPVTGHHLGAVCAYNILETANGVNNIKLDGLRVGDEGIAIIGNQGALGGTAASGATGTSSSSDDNLEFFGFAPLTPNDYSPIKNVLVQHNTFAGASSNGPRDNSAGTDTEQYWSVQWRGNIALVQSVQADVGGSAAVGGASDGTRTRNWKQRYRCDYSYSVFYQAGATHGTGETAKGEIPGFNIVYGTTAFPGFAADRSATGSNNHASPDYRLVNDAGGANKIALLPKLPAGAVGYPVDLFGVAIPLDGTALPGARQGLV